MAKHYDVAIAGGGVMGSATAYFLLTSPEFTGSVLVVECDPTYQTCATTRSLGGIRQQFSTPENVRMSMFGAEFARTAAETLAVDGEPCDVTFREHGYLMLASDSAIEVVLSNCRLQQSLGAAVEFLDPPALEARFPWLNRDGLAGAVFGYANEGWVDPNTLLQGFRRKARALGATYVEDVVVRFLSEGGRVTGLGLADGGEVTAGIVVNAAGSRAGGLAQTAGIDLPVWPRKRYAYVFDCRENLLSAPLTIDPSGVAFRPESQQYIGVVSPPEDEDENSNPLDFEIDYRWWEEVIWPALANRVPAFEAVKLSSAWAGHYDYNLFDQNAILGPHPEIAGILFCNGFSGHGLQQSPAAGRAISELIIHGHYRSIDLSGFSIDRVIQNRPVLEANIW